MPYQLDLSGPWQFCVDMGTCGANYADPQWPRDGWELVTVPGCWNHYAERLRLYEGVAWYAKAFGVPAAGTDTIATLRFEGANYLCEVWLNGEKLGTHEGGYSPFTFDVSACLKPGENVLVVRVDNRRHLLRMPFVVGWFNYGGLHRPVTLHLSRRNQITRIGVSSDVSSQTVRIEYELARPAGEEALSVRLRATTPDGWLELEQEKPTYDGNVFAFPLSGFRLWSPREPNVCNFQLELMDEAGDVLDVRHVCAGARTLEASGTELRLNGEPLRLNGINYLPINSGAGLTWSPETITDELALLAQLGVNGIRVHFPLDERFFSACDRAGLMVWCDLPIYCLEEYAGVPKDFFVQERNYVLAAQYVRETLGSYGHHPSIITWSLGNENSTSLPGAREFFERLFAEARAIDATRWLSYASLILMRDEETAYFDQLDVVGLNEYFGWYDRLGPHYANWEGGPPDLSVLKEKLDAFFARCDRPVVISEFGADSVRGHRSSDLALGSEDYHSALLEETFRIAAQYPRIVGLFPFCFNDYADPSKSLVRFWSDAHNHKGVVSANREKKSVFATLQRLYDGE